MFFKKEVFSMWLGPELSIMEQACISSYLSKDITFILYIYEPLKNIPQGTIIENGNKIRCIEIPQKSDIEYIVKSVNKCIKKLIGEKKFVFIDSLSTFTLHESSSKSLIFPGLLINTIRANNSENITFIFNIAEDVSRKRYMKNLNNYADEHIHLGLCT